MATEHLQNNASKDSIVLANTVLLLQTKILIDKIEMAGTNQSKQCYGGLHTGQFMP